MSNPTGPIKTAGFTDLDWSAATKYDDFIEKAATPLGWPVDRIRAHILIESDGNPKAVQKNNSNGWSYGLMQVVPYGVGWEGWHELVKTKAGLRSNASKEQVVKALEDPRINIAVGVEILESFYTQHKSLDKASSAFFTNTPNWARSDSVNGTTGAQYRDMLNNLIKEQEAFQPADPIRVIVGGAYPRIDYGFGSDVGLNYYKYGVGHGTQRPTQHTGYDVSVPCGTKLYTPISGTVDCVGSRGTPRWGQGCGAYADVDGGGVGNITIMGDSGHKLTLGHTRNAYVKPGDRVEAGQLVGTVGSMNGCHVHVEISVLRNGSYYLLDPGPALIEAMGGIAPVTYPEPFPVPQASEFDTNATIIALEDGLPVLQRADMNAPRTNEPLVKGDDFQASLIARGNDGAWYWITSRGNRVPIKGTNAADVLGIPVVATAPERLPELLADLASVIEKYEGVA